MRPLIVVIVTTVAGVVVTTVGGRLLWWADAPIWLLALPGAPTGNAIGQLALTRYYIDTFGDRLQGERGWWLLAPGMASMLLFLAGVFVFGALARATGGPGGEPVVALLVGAVLVTATVIYWLPKGHTGPDSDAR